MSRSCPLLRVERLIKSFGSGPDPVRVLDGVAFELNRGEVLCITGANGSGKTTLLRILAQLVEPDAGRVVFEGAPLMEAHRAAVGWCSGDERGFQLRLSLQDNLRIAACVQGVTRARADVDARRWAEALALLPKLTERMGGLSAGQRDRAGLLRALVHRPRLLLVDEPTRSQDAAGCRAVWGVLDELVGQGTAVVLVTHHAPSLQVPWRCARLVDGRLVALDESAWRAEVGRA